MGPYRFRIGEWYAFLGFVILGSAMAGDVSLWSITGASGMAFTIALSAALLAFAYSINDYFDGHTGKMYFVLPFIIAMAFVSMSRPFVAVSSAVFMTVFTMYSARPVRLKSVPFVSTFFNAAGFPLLFLVGLGTIPDTVGWLMFLLLSMLTGASQLIHEIVHMTMDMKDRVETTAMSMGYDKTRKLIHILIGLSVFITILMFLYDRSLLLVFVSTVFYAAYFAFSGLVRRIDDKTRADFRRLGILVGISWLIVIMSM